MTSLNVLPPSLTSVCSKLCPATGDSDLLGGYGDRGSQNSQSSTLENFPSMENQQGGGQGLEAGQELEGC